MSKPVIVEKHHDFVLRVSVDDFFYPFPANVLPGETDHSPAYLKRKATYERAMKIRDLFLQAFQDISSLPHDDPWSFYQIAGIHGLPYAPYDHVAGQSGHVEWGGYCTHGSVLFPMWHRPYVQLLEQSLILAALRVLAEAKLHGEEDLKLARAVRIPFLDWGSPRAAQFGVPSIFTDSTVTVNYPANKSFANPLRSFLAPADVKPPNTSFGVTGSDPNAPTTDPVGVNYGQTYTPPSGTPYLPANYPTVRYPDGHYQSQFTLLQMEFMRAVQWMLRPGIFGFLKVSDWTTFSNHYYDPANPDISKPIYGAYTSIEVVHDMVHDRFGGNGGHMSYPDEAGFDPIFFFHHANVDRLTAIWQYCYPDSWLNPEGVADPKGTYTIPPGTLENENTSLTPFRRAVVDGKDVFWTSKDARHVRGAFNYSYPEIENAAAKKLTPAQMLREMLAYYMPTPFEQMRWYLNIYNIPKNVFTGPYKIMAFLQTTAQEALTLPVTDPRYAGEIYVFSRGKDSRCAHCRDLDTTAKARGQQEGALIFGSMEITQTMTTLHLDTFPESQPGGENPTETPVVIYHENPAPNDPNVLSFTIALVALEPDGKRVPIPQGITWDVRQEFHEFDDPLSSSTDASLGSSRTKRAPQRVARRVNAKLFIAHS